jgi:ATP-dependent 26S proteasome regulatory subunit
MTAPSIIFIDEIDALVGKRSTDGASRDQVQERILTTFLTEMDGVSSSSERDIRSAVIVLGATNRIHAIDSALLRPGRFDELIPIDLPNETERLAILKVIARKMPFREDVDWETLAKETEGFSGALLTNLLQEAAYVALRADKTIIDRQCIKLVHRRKGNLDM